MHAWLPALGVVAPILAASVLTAAGKHLPRLVIDLLATGTAMLVAGLMAALVSITASGRVVSWVGGWTPRDGVSVGIVLVADRANASLALLCAVLTTCALIYSWRYFEEVEAHFHVLLLLFLTGLVGFALTGDLFNMFVFFELMGAVAYALTGYKIEEPESVQGAFNFGVINSLGAYFTLTGIGLLYARTGQLGLAQLSRSLSGHGADVLVVAAFTFVCTGWLVKAAAAPFHFWLADAHAVAPTPVCVLFSGVMAPLGVYGVARVHWTVFSDALPGQAVQRAFLLLGIVTALIGAVMCLMQRHIKRMLAYSTISHIGLFLVAFSALRTADTAGLALYLAGHAGVKAALFLLAGLLISHYGRIDEVTLHGRAAHRRLLGVLWVLGALGLAGMPPFGTGLGKAVVEESSPWLPVLFTLVSAVTAGAVLRAGLRVHFGLGPRPRAEGGEVTSGQQEESEVEEPLPRTPVTMLVAIIVLLALGLCVGLVPAVAQGAAEAAAQLVDRAGYVDQTLSGASASPALPEAVHWTASGVGFGLLAVALAVCVALIAIYQDSLPDGLTSLGRRISPVRHVLHRAHSGHIGDYVAWLLFGSAALFALVL